MLIRTPPRWRLPEGAVTPEAAWLDRRRLMRTLGVGGLAVAAGCTSRRAGAPAGPMQTTAPGPTADLYPARRDPRWRVERGLTRAEVAASYNNFYEFGADKAAVWKAVGAFEPWPWQVAIRGLCARPGLFDAERLIRRFPLSERVYRFRCVEAWSMVVPWTGFALADLVRWAQPSGAARYLRLMSVSRPRQMPGVAEQRWYPWPYYEALSLAEATHPLAFVATGIYGRPLPKQHGAPLRLALPWKYGFKSIKSVAVIEFVAERPSTFWNALAPAEYDFFGNVEPQVPHPRWSQVSERVIGTGERIPTRRFNGYGEVASLYA